MHHRSARLSVFSRELLCRRVIEEGWSITQAARVMGVSRQTGSKWVARFRTEGLGGLENRLTRPVRSPRRLSSKVVARIAKARLRLRWGPHRLGWALRMARSTVYKVLRRLGLNRLRRLDPRPVPIRYEWPHPGDLLHLDTKKLGRIGPGGGKHLGMHLKDRHAGIGWNYVHVAVDDHSRLAYAEELPDEHPATTVEFTQRAFRFFASHGIGVRRVLTDNGNPFRSKAFRELLEELHVPHKRTRPYTPRTNGKAEAMVKILLNGWAYARPYTDGTGRIDQLRRFMDQLQSPTSTRRA